mmetsp:Transcript_37290/g.84706  ORF Transcript_37290/g.84706 Transcript_37290/m.84706 type:complete len:229 (-) Transcript_37290:201-887(-)
MILGELLGHGRQLPGDGRRADVGALAQRVLPLKRAAAGHGHPIVPRRVQRHGRACLHHAAGCDTGRNVHHPVFGDHPHRRPDLPVAALRHGGEGPAAARVHQPLVVRGEDAAPACGALLGGRLLGNRVILDDPVHGDVDELHLRVREELLLQDEDPMNQVGDPQDAHYGSGDQERVLVYYSMRIRSYDYAQEEGRRQHTQEVQLSDTIHHLHFVDTVEPPSEALADHQ